MTSLPERVETAIIGSGFSGLAAARALRKRGRTDFVILEKGDDVGGTWRDNTYPGCTCDVPSVVYSFSWAPNPNWSQTYSPQPEIQAYLKRVAEREGLRSHVQLGTEVHSARWDGAASAWRLETNRGVLLADHLVAATGPLSEPLVPELPGLDGFPGRAFHSARWDHSLDLEGRRVAVIGTGASAIQFIPEVAARAEQVYVLQRTPAWVLPRRDRCYRPWEQALYRRLPIAQKAVRAAVYWLRESTVWFFLRPRRARLVENLGRRHLERQVPDPELRAKLTPSFSAGCKRLLLSNTYLRALARPNVELVTEGAAAVDGGELVTAGGRRLPVDTIIFGTGFHVTDMPLAERVIGPGGRSLAERFAGSPQALRGTAFAGFPNLYFMLGPNTGLGHTSVVIMAEAQARYIARGIERAVRRRSLLVPREDAQERWNRRLQARLQGTVWNSGGCRSWYIDARGRNSTLWPGLASAFRWQLSRFNPLEYDWVSVEDAAARRVELA